MKRIAPTKTSKRTISLAGGFAVFLAFVLMELGYGYGKTVATSQDEIRPEQVQIEVLLDKPGGHKAAAPGATVRVAILSTESFDATSIDPSSITIEGVPIEKRKNGRARASIEDVNGDDLMDLVVRVNAEGLNIASEPRKIGMQGKTLDGRLVLGGGCVQSSGVPCGGEILSTPHEKGRSGKAGKKKVGIEAVTAIIVSAGATLVSESCTPANGALDPNETATVSFCVQNTGGGDTVNLVGTLQATGGVTSPSGPQNYGVVVAGGPAVCRNFTFTVSGTCGGTVTASIQFQDGATDLGTLTYTFTLGTPNVVFTENFDGVTAPALPAGWVSASTAGAANCTPTGTCALTSQWTTVASPNDTAPNSAFHNEPTCVTDSTLDTPSIAITSAAAQLTFRNSFNLENTFDGGVLEISINGGAFTDIITAGGSFAGGGYNGTISVNFFSPIAGRQAWTGNSAGFITTTVNLPASASGQPIKLRFRLGTDCSNTVSGWNIDTVRVTDGFVCCVQACVITCPANVTHSNDPNQCGAVVTYSAPTTTGTCATITCAPASGSFFPVGTTTVTCTATAGPSCSFTVTVNDTQPPTITCPANITTKTPTSTATCAVATFTTTASDNCPGVTVLCNPPSGSCFPVGTTTVTCTATDASGNTATCSFTVTVFNVCLQDDSNPSIVFLANSITGSYRFCCGGTIFTGVAQVIKKGNVATFQHYATDRRVLATDDEGVFRGTASLQSPPGTNKCTIQDRDTRNNSCVCQ